MKRKSLVCLSVLAWFNIYSQVGIGTREPKGVLEVYSQSKYGSSNLWGLVLPVVDNVDKLKTPDGSPPVKGTLFFNNGIQSLCYIDKESKATCVVERIKQLATGDYVGYALTENGILYSWGDNSKGKLGRDVNGENPSKSPGKIHFPEDVKITSVIAKRDLAFAIDEEGKLYSWGNPESQQLGRRVSEINSAKRPGEVKFPSGIEISRVFIGGDFVIAKDKEGKLYSWGSNARNQLGRSNKGLLVGTTPKKIIGLSSIQDVSVSFDFTFALDKEGKLYSWGESSDGRLGREVEHASKADSPLAIKFPDGIKISSIAAGSDFGLALDAVNGKVYSWGNNSKNQLGRVPGISGDDPAEKPGKIGLSISLPNGRNIKFTPSFIAAGHDQGVILAKEGYSLFFGKEKSTNRLVDLSEKNVNMEISSVVLSDFLSLLNDKGELYLFNEESVGPISPVSAGVSSFVIGKGYHYLLIDGTVYSRGEDNSKGQLGRAKNRFDAEEIGEIDL